MISCFKCNDPIIFDDSWVSERTGRKIPLNEYTHEPHKCAAAEFISQGVECKYCKEEIVFDSAHLSKSNKKIPLNPETMEAHSCQEWKEAHPKQVICKYCLETEITFDSEHMTEKGRYIPIEVATLEPHKCSKRIYNPNTKQTTTVLH